MPIERVSRQDPLHDEGAPANPGDPPGGMLHRIVSRRYGIGLLLGLSLAACGGGSSGGGAVSAPPPSPPPPPPPPPPPSPPPPPPITSGIHVDSANGDDTAAGTTRAPLRTLAAIPPVASGDEVRLAAGSDFRESLEWQYVDDMLLTSFGDGPPPVIDCADTITATWTRPDAAYPNVWTVEQPHGFLTGTSQMPVVRNGIQMQLVNSRAAVDSTPGSYHSPHDEHLMDHNPALLEIHARSDPNNDGNTYATPVREWGLNQAFGTGKRIRVSGIHFRNNGSNDGSARFGEDCSVRQCIFENGHKHNLLFESGVFEDCCVPFTTDYGGTAIVLFTRNGAGKTGSLRRCHFLARVDRSIQSNSHASYAHGAERAHEELGFEQCAFDGYATAMSGELGALWSRGCYARRSGPFSGYSASARHDYLLVRQDGLKCQACAVYTPAQHQYHDSAFYVGVDGMGQGVIRLATPGERVTLANCSFHAEPDLHRSFLEGLESFTSGEVAISRSVFSGGTQLLFALPSRPPIVSDFNIFYLPPVQFHAEDGAPIMQYGDLITDTLAAWQQATGQDANSVFCKAPDQTVGNPNALWLAWAEAAGGTDPARIGPAAGDFRINPRARVYTASGEPLIGTFADGSTPVTAAGPRQHWDWDLRGPAAGASRRWPVVPDSISACQAYVRAPDAWNHYP